MKRLKLDSAPPGVTLCGRRVFHSHMCSVADHQAPLLEYHIPILNGREGINVHPEDSLPIVFIEHWVIWVCPYGCRAWFSPNTLNEHDEARIEDKLETIRHHAISIQERWNT